MRGLSAVPAPAQRLVPVLGAESGASLLDCALAMQMKRNSMSPLLMALVKVTVASTSMLVLPSFAMAWVYSTVSLLTSLVRSVAAGFHSPPSL